MRKNEIVDALRRDVSGGTTTVGDVLTPAYLNKNLDEMRAVSISRVYQKFGYLSINPICYQRFYLQYDATLQISGANYITYKLPPVIQLGIENGIRYLGGLNCDRNWRQIRSRQELATVQSNHYTSLHNHPDDIYYLFDGNRNIVQIFNASNNTEGLAECIFQSPSENPFYNEDLDDYPASKQEVGMIRDLLYERLAITRASEKESLPYNQPTGEVSQPPRNLRLQQPNDNQ